MNKVCVLMSTYNGEKYLKQQIESIIRQKNVDIEIIVRDDGSSDSTVDLLMQLSDRYKMMKILLCKNVGVAKSFMLLVDYAAKNVLNCEYFAFADQDDVWDDNKLSVAFNAIARNNNIPMLYCSNLRVVDSELNYFRLAYRCDYGKSVGNKYLSLILNKAAGCTMVFNRKLLDLTANKNVHNIYMHDWFVYTTASFFGKVIYDPVPHISYRQHHNNVCGMHIRNGWMLRIRDAFKSESLYIEQSCRCFLKAYRELLSDIDLIKISKITNYNEGFFNKIKLVLDKDLKRESFFGNIKLIVFIVMRRL